AADQNKPRNDEIGLALPIKITYRADNMRTWNFAYEALRREPLVELNRLELNSLSLSDPNNQNIEASATYIFVPKLFETIDAVKRVLKKFGATKPAKPPPASPLAEGAGPGAGPAAVPPAGPAAAVPNPSTNR